MADISKINLGGVEYDIRDQKLKEDVEKKVDKTYVDDEAERVVSYAEEVADNAEKAAKKYADENKVAKVDGKQLSTEDFTTTLKQKLDGLTNYDDADVRSAITELQNNLDAIVNGDATSAIDSIQEILAFLSTITDTQTLAGIVADLKQYVDDKVASGGGGITEEKEVYIGEEAPTDDGAKLWIDTDDESGESGGGSSGESVTIEVDDTLSLESTNPVQNKVVTEALEGKSNKRFIYFGDSEEELNYNLETLSLLEGENAPDIYVAEGMMFQFSVNANEQPCFISVSMWSLYLQYLPGMSINDIYITIGSTGLAEMHTPDYTALGNPISVPSGEILNGMGSDWVNLVIENGEADWSPLPLKSIMNSNDSGSSWILPNTIKVVKESGVATGVDFYYYEAGGKGGIIRFGLDGKIQDFFVIPIAIDSTDDSTSSSVIAERKLAYSLGAEIDGCTTLKKVQSSGTHEGSGITMLCYDYTILDGTSLKVWRLWEDGYFELKSTTSLV